MTAAINKLNVAVSPEILLRATAAIGTKEEAERWLKRPAMALGGLCPIDVIATPDGHSAVETLLNRLEYGVYI